MDNVSHSLAGIALAEALRRTPRFSKATERHPQFFSAMLVTSFFANNLPDLDSFVAYFLQPGTLGNLLNHRGYTHSFVFAPLGGAIAAIATKWLFRRSFEFKEGFVELCGLGMLGVLLHFFMDFWNDYGVHPFWPFLNRWYYGDLLSVVEPLFWFALLPLGLEVLQKSRFRWILFFFGALMLGAVWLFPFTRGGVAGASTLWAVLAFGIQRKFRGLKPAVGLLTLVLLIFSLGSALAKDQIRVLFSKDQIFQLIASPAPGDPFCWRIVVVSQRDLNYHARLGSLSLWPRFVSPRTCAFGVFEEHSAPLIHVEEVQLSESIVWAGEFKKPVAEMHELKGRSCEFAQFLRFARAPFWNKTDAGEIQLGDLRYDRGRSGGFSGIKVRNGELCLKTVPPWIEPVEP